MSRRYKMILYKYCVFFTDICSTKNGYCLMISCGTVWCLIWRLAWLRSKYPLSVCTSPPWHITSIAAKLMLSDPNQRQHGWLLHFFLYELHLIASTVFGKTKHVKCPTGLTRVNLIEVFLEDENEYYRPKLEMIPEPVVSLYLDVGTHKYAESLFRALPLRLVEYMGGGL